MLPFAILNICVDLGSCLGISFCGDRIYYLLAIQPKECCDGLQRLYGFYGLNFFSQSDGKTTVRQTGEFLILSTFEAMKIIVIANDADGVIIIGCFSFVSKDPQKSDCDHRI